MGERPHRRVRRAVVAGLLAFVTGLLALVACGGEPRPPNIVLIVIDTLRRDKLSCYGDTSVPTPNIDALAARGRAYEHYTASYHQTSMSMAALFTGRTPSIETRDPAKPLPWTGQTWCGMARFAAAGDDLCIPGSLPTLAERLRDAGYWTIAVASNVMLFEPSGFSRGFSDFVEVGHDPAAPVVASDARVGEWFDVNRTWRIVNRAARAAVSRRPEAPLFLYVHYMDVHDWEHGEGPYEQSVGRADTGVGALLGDLEQRGLLDDTIVVLTSDHGEHLGERHPPFMRRERRTHAGNPSYEALLAVPLIVAPAPGGGDPLGALALPRTEDLHRWLLTVAGVPPSGSADMREGELFLSEMTWQTYRDGPYKSAFDRRSNRGVLFDLEQDPGEQRSVALERPEVLEAHRKRIAALSSRLVAQPAAVRALSEDDRARLQALGYLEPE